MTGYHHVLEWHANVFGVLPSRSKSFCPDGCQQPVELFCRPRVFVIWTSAVVCAVCDGEEAHGGGPQPQPADVPPPDAPATEASYQPPAAAGAVSLRQ